MRGGLFLSTFAGLSGGTLGGIFAFFAALTIVLYLLKLRRRQVLVPFLGLWERLLVQGKASVLHQRLRRILSLLLSLLLVAALVLALGDPRADGERDEARSIAIVVDVSASMGVRVGGRTRLDLARAKTLDWLSGLGTGDEFLIVEMGSRPRPLAAFSGSRTILEERVSELRVLDVSADLGAALLVCRDALRGRSNAEIIILSDGALSLPAVDRLGALPPISFESVVEDEGVTLENVAIVAFSARRIPVAPDRFEVLVEVENTGTHETEIELSLHSADSSGGLGRLLDMQHISLAGSEKVSKIYEKLDHAEEGLIAQIRRVDGKEELFNSDNIARTLLSPRKPVRVLIVGEANNFLEAALSVDESLLISSMPRDEYPPAETFELTIFDGVFPQRHERTGAAFYLGVPREEQEQYPLSLGESLSLFGFDSWKKDSPIFRQIDPYDVQVLTGRELVPQEEDLVLARSAGQPILIQGERAAGRFLALGFSPRESDFVMRAVWPLFILNIIEELVPRGRSAASLGLRTGELWRIVTPQQSGEAWVRGPLRLEAAATEDRPVPLFEGRALFYGAEAGFYEVITGESMTRFSASMLDSGESRLIASKTLFLEEGSPLPSPQMRPRAGQRPWFWLLFGVFFVSFIEWWTYHRRWTL